MQKDILPFKKKGFYCTKVVKRMYGIWYRCNRTDPENKDDMLFILKNERHKIYKLKSQ